MQKRGTPYFFPMWGSSPYARNLRGLQLLFFLNDNYLIHFFSHFFLAFFPLRKRYETKRNLIDAFTRDDPSAFGYDKKKRSSLDEDEDEKRKRSSN